MLFIYLFAVNAADLISILPDLFRNS